MSNINRIISIKTTPLQTPSKSYPASHSTLLTAHQKAPALSHATQALPLRKTETINACI